jgi:hypothetical protein
MKKLILFFAVLTLAVINVSCEKTIDDSPARSLEQQYPELSNFVSDVVLEWGTGDNVADKRKLEITINDNNVVIRKTFPLSISPYTDTDTYTTNTIELVDDQIIFKNCILNDNGYPVNNLVFKYIRSSNDIKLIDNTDNSSTYNFTFIDNNNPSN